MSFTIHGIQHLGVGVPDHELSWKWYRKFFGMDIPLFNDEAEAPLMTIYTKGKVICVDKCVNTNTCNRVNTREFHIKKSKKK